MDLEQMELRSQAGVDELLGRLEQAFFEHDYNLFLETLVTLMRQV